jgi:CrcB protein
MRAALFVAAGGALGSLGRYALTYFVQSRQVSPFPTATLIVNVTGSLLLGFIARYLGDSVVLSPEARLLLTTGFCGGYTTFSTFSFETARMYQEGDYRRAAVYVVLSVVLSIAAMFAGFALARLALAAQRGIG